MVQLEFEPMECSRCGMIFFVSGKWKQNRREKGDTFYCPHGHPQAYLSAVIPKLTKEKEELETRLRDTISANNFLKAQLDEKIRPTNSQNLVQGNNRRKRAVKGSSPEKG